MPRAEVSRRHHGVDVDVVARREGQQVLRPAHGVIDVDVVGDRDRTVGGQQGIADADACFVAARGGDGVVRRVEQPKAGLALRRTGIDAGAATNLHLATRRFHKAAVAPQIAAACAEAAVDLG